MYTITSYGEMIADKVRMRSHEAALRAVVRPGCTVLDLGAGTGIFSFIACRLGAARVYAIEPNESIHLARSMAYDQGLSDRIDFIQDFSTRVVLPHLADVLVADIRGALPVFRNSLATIADARTRLLAPGGVLIPRRDTLHIAIAEMPSVYATMLRPWSHPDWQLDLGGARTSVLNSVRKVTAKPEQLLSEGVPWASIDYSEVTEICLEGKCHAVVRRPGTAHGLVAWFQSTLCDGVEYYSGPGDAGDRATIYGQLLFPWLEPVPVDAGDEVSARIVATPTDDDYIWTWESVVCEAATKREKARFRQSTFLGDPAFLPHALDKNRPTLRPVRNRHGEAAAVALQLMTGELPLVEIVRQIAVAFPDVCRSEAEASALVKRMAWEYSDPRP